MLLHLNAAQEAMGTHLPIVEIDRRLHAEPRHMREVILEELEKLPPEYDTVLFAMGFCGGSLDMEAIVRALVENGFDGYVRPDHGRMIWGETGRAGYGLYDRALGAAYLNGLFEAVEKELKRR